MQTPGDMPSSVKWLEVNARHSGGDDATARERVIPSAFGSEVVENFPAKPLNLITIWGAARQGKSFFLNVLAQKDNLFEVSGETKPCTSGADISTVLTSGSEFARGDHADIPTAESAPPSPAPAADLPMVAFVDVEGQGDRHRSYDVLLATPLLLVSKVMIFNWKGLPNQETMLDQLAVMTNAASEIGRGHREGAFGHLIILLRDVPSKREDSARDLILGREDPKSAFTDDEELGIKNRNDTRTKLDQAFQSVSVRCLPSPHANIIDTNGVSLTELAPEFQEKMAKIRGQLVDVMADPHLFGGEIVVGGHHLRELMSSVCDKVNEGKQNISPSSLMDSVKEKSVKAIHETALEDFKDQVAKFGVGAIHSKEETGRFIKQAEQRIMESFDRDTENFGRIAKESRGKMEQDLQQVSEICIAREEKKVHELALKAMGVVEGIRAVAIHELENIESLIPIRGEGALALCVDRVCHVAHAALEHFISESVNNSVREDIKESIPTLQEFMASFQARFRMLTDKNELRIAVSDGIMTERKMEAEMEKVKKSQQIAEEKFNKSQRDAEEKFKKSQRDAEEKLENSQREAEKKINQALQGKANDEKKLLDELKELKEFKTKVKSGFLGFLV